MREEKKLGQKSTQFVLFKSSNPSLDNPISEFSPLSSILKIHGYLLIDRRRHQWSSGEDTNRSVGKQSHLFNQFMNSWVQLTFGLKCAHCSSLFSIVFWIYDEFGFHWKYTDVTFCFCYCWIYVVLYIFMSGNWLVVYNLYVMVVQDRKSTRLNSSHAQ